MLKINWKKILKPSFWVLVYGIMLYTRFINLGWGFPYPMHPDERNMANAVQQLHCNLSTIQIPNLSDCFNPHFFAYGQFPLYMSYIGAQSIKFFGGNLGTPISFQEAAFSLRMISAIASIISVLFLYRLVSLLISKKTLSPLIQASSFFILIFSPVLIQFAHFGTTESLLILFYSLIIYFSLLFLQKKLLLSHYVLLTSLMCGLALATKVSSLLYLVIPAFVLFQRMKKKSFYRIALLLLFSALFFVLFSPHTIISFKEFMFSMDYESGVALGQPIVFYTRQFNHTIPILFQLTKIYPYALNLPIFLFGLLGMVALSWKQKEINLLRLAFILVFLPNAFMYAKWTRFIAPTFPLIILFAILFISKITIPRLVLSMMVFILLIPGIAYISIYQNPDVRFEATNWINNNIHSGAKILSETANVVDVPLNNNSYGLISFNFYDLDTDTHLQEDLGSLLSGAEYIIVPSRRIFKNLSPEYPILNEYYQRLFSGTLGFKQVAEITSYPTIRLFGKKILEFPDENAEETWTVFDHPVIRIYKRIQNLL